MTEEYRFILFISGMSVKSSRAVENLQQICDKHLKGKFELEIIDVSVEKSKAELYQVFALPTLIKSAPAPVRTILGDLSDTKKVLRILDIDE